jgi:hypothetical protein
MSTIKEIMRAIDEPRTKAREQAAEYTQMAGVEVSLTGGLMKVLAPQATRERFLEALNAVPTDPIAVEITKSTCDAESASDRGTRDNSPRRAALPFNRAHRSF